MYNFILIELIIRITTKIYQTEHPEEIISYKIYFYHLVFIIICQWKYA